MKPLKRIHVEVKDWNGNNKSWHLQYAYSWVHHRLFSTPINSLNVFSRYVLPFWLDDRSPITYDISTLP